MFASPLNPTAKRGLVVLAALALAGVASADSITLNFDLTPGGMVRTDWAKDIDVARFNPGLGTLTSIDMHFDWMGQLSGSVTNQSATSNAVYFEHDLVLGLTTRTDDYIASETVASTVFAPTLAVGQTANYGPVMASGSRDASLSGSDPLASLFVGNGNVDLRVFAQAETGQSANGPIQTEVDTFAGVKGRLTYNYAPVPEPASMAALGLGALGLLRRRKVGGAK